MTRLVSFRALGMAAMAVQGRVLVALAGHFRNEKRQLLGPGRGARSAGACGVPAGPSGESRSRDQNA